MKGFVVTFLSIIIFSLMLFIPAQNSFANILPGAVNTDVEIILTPDHCFNCHHDWYWWHHHHHEYYYDHYYDKWHH
ncbi:hypothetical protein Thena_0845 [Thermodesulfobium narugense DSM 14796]|uniref:Uncharacterized protein n=1 Tax=Thermodesulfobium narugense DSM 14796 TaxID=747365 RepID=M1E7H9_9BACT|nr:hypothetical protein [Thermodesulfobium narugense]AEE14475.1 hypothetical protein Thena_0845 [Thermodesulfobium narugense DSM 14796]